MRFLDSAPPKTLKPVTNFKSQKILYTGVIITFWPISMFLEICMQFHSVVFAISRQINKQKLCESNNLLCARNKLSVKYQAQGGF